MLEIIEFGKDEYAFPSLIVLGCFDAIHEGHRELFKKAKLQAKINGLDLGVMMFREGKGGKLLYSFDERIKMLEKYNVKFVLAIDFTPEFKDIAPLDFLNEIEDKINVKAYMSGKDFRFGKGAKGKSSTLKNFAEDEENGVWYMPVKDVMCDGEKISTTLVKSCLDSGDVMRANALLGEPFYLDGQVSEGAHRGTQILGFPTVNIVYPEWKYQIRHGVYKALVTADGEQYSAIANFGACPTFDDDREVLEAHIKDFSGDLYGKAVRVSFICYMRAIKKFASPEELASQLAEDKAALELPDEDFAARYAQAYQVAEEESATKTQPSEVQTNEPEVVEIAPAEVITEEIAPAEQQDVVPCQPQPEEAEIAEPQSEEVAPTEQEEVEVSQENDLQAECCKDEMCAAADETVADETCVCAAESAETSSEQPAEEAATECALCDEGESAAQTEQTQEDTTLKENND